MTFGGFCRVRHPEIVPVLVEQLPKASASGFGRNTERRRSLLEALRFQTGEDVGADPAAWKAWLEEKKK